MNLSAISLAEGPLLSHATVSANDFLIPLTRDQMSFSTVLMSNQYGRFSVETNCTFAA